MRTGTIIILMAATLLAISCDGSETGKPPRNLRIPENDLAAILTDTYITAGMLDLFTMRDTWSKRDSILNYIDVIESHGYTYEQFDATMKYYFTARPRKLSKIYDRVTGNLLEMETVVMTEQNPIDDIAENLWPGKVSYSFPEDFPRDPVWFDLPVEKPGEYVLNADIRIFTDDQSLNPRVTVYFSYPDSTGEERREYWQEFFLEKDGMFRKVQISHRLDSIPGARLRGWLMNHDNQPGKWEKHARVANISIVYSGDSASQIE
ncbi:MAG: DUF4296 domain-containing protein [Bacteroidota bacterium]|nr:DUF4296 domain-containing protein [Bacteroidota bacterium]